MKGFTTTIISIILGALFRVHSAFAQTVHVVGDNLGWTVPSDGAATYTNWASGKTFSVGDILVFNFMTNNHDVQQVPKASFDACTSDNGIGNLILTGPANVTLSSAGEQYYICTVGRHCQGGQKLAISVSGTPGTANPPTGTTTTPPPSGRPAAPSPNSNQPDDCAPAPSPSFNPANPTGGSGIPPPSTSSSTALFASLLSTLGFIAMGVFLV